MIPMVLLFVLILAILGTLPTWGHSRNWGYGPSGGVGVVLSDSSRPVLVLAVSLTAAASWLIEPSPGPPGT